MAFVIHVVDGKPTTRDLMLIKWKKGNEMHQLRIIATIGNEWETIGKILRVPEVKLQTCWTQSDHDPQKCCSNVFNYWFQNPPQDYPLSWRGFIDLLKDVNFTALAEELREALINRV